MGMSEEREARIAEGNARARIILEEHREQAFRLVACLVEHGHVNEPEFLRLMSGE
jgi:ATP-dependent Zn protease